MAQQFKISNDSGKNAKSLVVEFKITRTTIKGIELAPSDIKMQFHLLGSNVAQIDFLNQLVTPNEQLAIIVHYEGEPLQLEVLHWKQNSDIDSSFKILTVNKNIEEENNLLRRHLKRLDFIETLQDPIEKKYHSFFADLDYQTNPPLVAQNPNLTTQEKKKRTAIITRTIGVLAQRVDQRRLYGKINQIPPQQDLLNSQDINDVSYISDLQMAIYKAHFGNPLDSSDFGKAFEMFANGELRINPPKDGYWNSEPDSAFEFFFAEFGWLAIDNNSNEQDWGVLIGQLVKSQRIMMIVYQPRKSAPYYFDDYSSDNFDNTKQVNEAFKQNLRQEFLNKTPNEVRLAMGQNAFIAFPLGFKPQNIV
jgi:hypothetical protein